MTANTSRGVAGGGIAGSEQMWSDLFSLFEHEISFRREHKGNTRMVRNAMVKPEKAIHTFSYPILRNSFLFACLDFTKNEKIEHLIVGFGRRMYGGTDVSALLHVKGDETSVNIPKSVENAIKSHLAEDESNEIILYHNHPQGILRPSTTDRGTMFNMKFMEPLMLLKRVFGGATIRFYVGGRGQVKPIKWPNKSIFAAGFEILRRLFG